MADPTVEHGHHVKRKLEHKSDEDCCDGLPGPYSAGICSETDDFADFVSADELDSTVAMPAHHAEEEKEVYAEGGKACKQCSTTKPLTAFYPNSNGRLGVLNTCKTCINSVDNPVSVTEKKCFQCGFVKLASEFHRAKTRSDGLRSNCKKCHMGNASSKKAFLNRLFNSNKYNYGHQPGFDLVNTSTEEMAENQLDECGYCGVSLNYAQGSSFQASVEAMDPSKGHTRANCVLIILELNNRVGWSPALVVEHIRTRHTQQTNTIISNLIQEVNTGRSVARRQAKLLLKMAKSTTKTRNSKKHRADNQHECTLTLEDIYRMILAQNNRCYWSGQPLDWHGKVKQWVPSLERLDVTRGYTPENVVLVCRAFNAIDHRSSMKHKKGGVGHQGWSKEKYAIFFASACRKYSSQLTDADKQLEVGTQPARLLPLSLVLA